MHATERLAVLLLVVRAINSVEITPKNDEFLIQNLKLKQKRTDNKGATWYSTVAEKTLSLLANDVTVNLDESSCLIRRAATVKSQSSQDVLFVDKAKIAGFTHLYRTHIAARPWCLFDFVVPSTNRSSKAAKLAGEFCIGEHVAGGAAVGDYDNDGLQDIFFSVFHGRSRLYRNRGDGTFVDVTSSTGVGPEKYANGAGWVDIDQDGDLDLYVTSLGNSRHFLYVNYGGYFTEEAVARNVGMEFPNKRKLAGMTPNFGDFDNDGYPDIYVTEWILHSQGKPSASRLLRNKGKQNPGVFEDVTSQAGVMMDSYWREHALNAGTFTFGASFTDFDNDGKPELLITGDYGESKMFWNNGNGTFTQCTRACGLVGDVDAMGHAIGDLNNDGNLEWFSSAIFDNATSCEVTGCMFGDKGNKLFKNLGNRKFQEISREVGVQDGGWGWGSAFFDFNNDGYLDIVHTNGIDFPSTTVDDTFQKQNMRLFKNYGKGPMAGKMKEVAKTHGLNFDGQGRGLLKFDYDDDGDEDVVVVANVGPPIFYENQGGNRNKWLRILVKNRCMNNKNRLCDSYGARVTVTDPTGRQQLQEVGSSTHFLGQSEPNNHFGLGQHESNLTVTVRWPAKNITLKITDVVANKRIKVIRPERNSIMSYSSLNPCHKVEIAELIKRDSKVNPIISPDKKSVKISYNIMVNNGKDEFSYRLKVDPPLPSNFTMTTSVANVTINFDQDVTSLPVCKNGRMILPNTPVVTRTDGRLLSGVSNNKVHLLWGAAGTDLRRHMVHSYGDNISLPAASCFRSKISCFYPTELSGRGSTRPSPRKISNEIFAQSKSIFSARRLSDLHSHFGQFVSHDTDFSSPLARFEFQGQLNEVWMPIKVPKGDVHFDPARTGTSYLPFTRSTYNRCTGLYPKGLPREQVNKITSFIDASHVYGVTETRSRALRSMKDGKMRLNTAGIIPSNDRGLANDNPVGRNPKRLVVAGDTRANVQPGLVVLHSLMVREHNRQCDEYKKKKPQASDEETFQYAKKMIAAIMQAITYREYLPALLGGNVKIPPYKGYNPTVNPSVSNIFATAAFRFGHSQVNEKIFRLKEDGNMSSYGHLLLRETYFNPERVELEGGLEPILRGMIAFPSQELDVKMVDEMRNALFPVGRDNGLDLASMNIQRGRDHGLPDFNTVRKSIGLSGLTDFNQITKDRQLSEKLKSLYRDINNIDLWVGGLAEDHEPGSELGPTFRKIVVDSFVDIRDGDRFWYEYYLTKEEIVKVNSLTLAKIIERNSNVKNVQENVFFSSKYCSTVKDNQCVAKETNDVEDLQAQRKTLLNTNSQLQSNLNSVSSELLKLKYKVKQQSSTDKDNKGTRDAVIALGVLLAITLALLLAAAFLLRNHPFRRRSKLDEKQGSINSTVVFSNGGFKPDAAA